MRVSNVAGRARIEWEGGRAYDVETISRGRFGPDPQVLFDEWPAFVNWADAAEVSDEMPATSAELGQLDCPVPRPRQIFAVGLNYADHASESGFQKPDHPVIFAKFVSSLDGPYTKVALPPGSVDWEVELVVTLGRGGRNISKEAAWDHVAGLSVGQDLSERELQHSGPAPQFGLAKSHAGFSPIGPWLVTLDEIADPDNLALGCSINGETVQSGSTKDLIFPVPELIAHLSRVVELFPGDVIFTGTPAGVGAGRKPPRFLQPGDVLTSWVTGIGEIEQHLTSNGSSPV
jgi:2,4-diketo-3-deoxy-L-fuconate hydrolase